MNESTKLLAIIKNAQRILITSHISPDPDAVSSLLLACQSIQMTYPKKAVEMILEEEVETLNYLPGFKKIKFCNLASEVNKFQPDLLLMLDGMNYERFSRNEGPVLREYVATNKPKTIIIDHHEKQNVDKVDLYIHRGSPSTAQDVYVLFIEELGFKKPTGFDVLTLAGICADTGFFAYQNKFHRETFRIASDLIDQGARLETIQSLLSHYSLEQTEVMAELFKNYSCKDNYNYSFLTDEFSRRWKDKQRTAASLKRACESFVNSYVKNVDDRTWGFIVYADLDGTYSLSLRSEAGQVDVSKIAGRLGGGGHIPAAGATIEAENIQTAIAKVQSAIAHTSN